MSLARLGRKLAAGHDDRAAADAGGLGDGGERGVRVGLERGDRALAFIAIRMFILGSRSGGRSVLRFFRCGARRGRSHGRAARWRGRTGGSGSELRSSGASTAAKIWAAVSGWRLRLARLLMISARSAAGSMRKSPAGGSGHDKSAHGGV